MCFYDDLAANLFLYFAWRLSRSSRLMEGLSDLTFGRDNEVF